jgi:cyanophycin synthetase
MHMSPQWDPSQFSIPGKLVYRPGCGYGLHQGHLVAEVHWQAGHIEGLTQFVAHFQEMLDEPLPQVPASADLAACTKWLVGALGTVLRNFKIATVRGMHVLPFTKETAATQSCKVVLPTASVQSSMIGLQWLLNMVNVPLHDREKAESVFLELQQKLKPYATPSANQWRTIQAAYDTGYPVTLFMESTVCIGTGKYRRLFSSFVTESTSMLGMRVSQNKWETANLLRDHGLPGSKNKRVRSLEEALAAAKEMGFPCVIKPNDKDRGEGVAADLMQEAEVVAAYQAASKLSTQVLVEKHQAGFTHRFSVVQDKVMRVAKHVAFGVVGNGISSIEELVAAKAMSLEEKKRARRNLTGNLALDDEALGLLNQYGLHKASVPELGQYVKLRRKDNISAGGQRITLDMVQEVHPDNLQLALHAVRLIGLDFAGVDLITPDVGRSWRELAVTICEINGNPQLVARDDPDMYKHVLAHVMPKPARVQANLVVLVRTPNEDDIKHLIARFSPPTSDAGLSMALGTWINGQICAGPFANAYSAALSLTANGKLQQITGAMTIHELLHFGLPWGQIDLLVLPWKENSQVPNVLQNDYQELLRLLLPHAEKTAYAKGRM